MRIENNNNNKQPSRWCRCIVFSKTVMDTDNVPVRDPGAGPSHEGGLTHLPGDSEQRRAKERRAISKITREELEDKYLRLHDENLVLKRHARKQEDKIKKMATKLLRLVNDKKKQAPEGAMKKGRDIEMEEMLDDLHTKVRELTKQNEAYKNKLMIAKQQLATQSKRQTSYPHVQSRIDTGRAKAAPDTSRQNARPPVDDRRSATPRAFRQDVLPRYGHSLLEEAREENKRLEDFISQLQDQINILEDDKEMLQEQLQTRELEHDDEILQLKRTMNQGQRSNIQENVELIRLQRELKDKSSKLTALQTQFASLQENLKTVKKSHDAMVSEIEEQNKLVQNEQNKVLTLQNQLKKGSASQRIIAELQERISDVEREKEILREANEKLLNSAFDAERERQYRANEKQLKVQIAQLEATLKGDLNDKNTILDKLTEERESHEKLQTDFRELQIKHFQVKQQLDDLQDKMRFFNKESAIDFAEIEEALILVKRRKEQGSQDLDFLERVDEEVNRDLKKQVITLQAEHADTINELEKTRNMLILQHKINRDYQAEVENSTHRLEEYKTEYDTKLEEYSQLLDIRAARIKKLERQLRDIAYGTKQYKIADAEVLMDDEMEEVDESVKLERGQNLMEIHIQKIEYSQEGLRVLDDSNPATFVTYEFFEYELQSTPVVKGSRPVFDFTSQYIVTVDDFLLHHIMKESTTLEVHQAIGTEFRTIAACQLHFRELLDGNQNRIHGIGHLIGAEPGRAGVQFGTVEFWVRLRVPMDQALRLFRERVKALGYMTSNQRATQQAIQALDDDTATTRRGDQNINELSVRIIRCNGLKARRQGVQPSPYSIYRFFDFADHDSTIIQSSNTPEFNDTKVYPVPMNADLDRYLKTESLQVYVFDDTDPEESAYLGLAKIPLISLAHNKAIKGTFELKQNTNKTNGTIDVFLQWQYTYLAPQVGGEKMEKSKLQPRPPPAAVTPAARKPPIPKPAPSPQVMSNTVLASGPGTMDVTPIRTAPLRRGPAASSTPVQPDSESRPREALVQQSDILEPVSIRTNSGALPPPPILTINSPEESDQELEPSSNATPYQAQLPPEPRTATTSQAGENFDDSGEGDSGPEPLEASVEEELRRKTSEEEASEERPSQKDESVSEQDASEDLEDVVAKEMRVQFGTDLMDNSERLSDTNFEAEEEASNFDEDTDDEDDVVTPAPDREGKEEEEEIVSTKEDLMSSDNDSVVMSPAMNRPASAQANDNVVTVTISHVSLEPETRVVEDENVERLFVEYRFLGCQPEELETPFSLPKPKPDHHIVFNFKKVFHIDPEENRLRRDYLASMLLPEDTSEGKIRFTLVSEPPEDKPDLECEDQGYAYVDVRDILKQGKDMHEQDIDIVDANDESLMIGTMNVTVECVAALRAVESELQYDESDEN
ncbi:protein fantom-like isoform X2 [Anneissia japonica]|uniref:protein fantom-like isoform X2 n=1 Tax=Anneissia japonica TaxID=1529436 RepID=UPI00142588AD|nr:protein fantom-like isoform X2 [Anneissia japonica]